jgi:hydrogenase/urease accessory protein HupE
MGPKAMCPPVLAVLLLLALAPWAYAHPAPYSYLDIVFRGGNIDGTLVVHVIDIAHELKIDPPETLHDAATLERLRDRITGVITPGLLLEAGGRLEPSWTTIEPLPDDQAMRLRFRIPDQAPGALRIDTNLFPYDPQHQTFITIYEDIRLTRQLIFDANTDPYIYYSGTTQGAFAVMRVFVASGIHHILIGPDHILFLIALLLTGGTPLTLVRIVTAFTIGHSVTLSLAALNVVTPPPTLIEPAIALSIVFVGADNLVRGDGRDLRAWVALAFGLIHGFGFANVLRDFGLPDNALIWSLLSFNVGVEIGQLAIVLVVASALAAIRRYDAVMGQRLAFAGSLVVIAAGTYWFVERVFFPTI